MNRWKTITAKQADALQQLGLEFWYKPQGYGHFYRWEVPAEMDTPSEYLEWAEREGPNTKVKFRAAVE